MPFKVTNATHAHMQISKSNWLANPWVHWPWTYGQHPANLTTFGETTTKSTHCEWRIRERFVFVLPLRIKSKRNIYFTFRTRAKSLRHNALVYIAYGGHRHGDRTALHFCAKLLLSFEINCCKRLPRQHASEKGNDRKTKHLQKPKKQKHRHTRVSIVLVMVCGAFFRRKKNKSLFSIVLATPLTMHYIFCCCWVLCIPNNAHGNKSLFNCV